jgi:hypothetical protein
LLTVGLVLLVLTSLITGYSSKLAQEAPAAPQARSGAVAHING